LLGDALGEEVADVAAARDPVGDDLLAQYQLANFEGPEREVASFAGDRVVFALLRCCSIAHIDLLAWLVVAKAPCE
jgi:hypothetical protein